MIENTLSFYDQPDIKRTPRRTIYRSVQRKSHFRVEQGLPKLDDG